MKYLLIGFTAIFMLAVVLSDCRQKEAKKDVTEFISGTDTIVVIGSYTIDVTKCKASTGHYDAGSGIFRIKF